MRLGDEDWSTIVGVVSNVRQSQLEEVEQEMVYFPLVLDAGGEPNIARTIDIVIRITGDPLGMVSMLRDRLHALNPRIPIENPRAMQAIFESATAS